MDKQIKDLSKVIVTQLNGLAYLLISFFMIFCAGFVGLYFLSITGGLQFYSTEISIIIFFGIAGIAFIVLAINAYIRARDLEIKMVGEPIK